MAPQIQALRLTIVRVIMYLYVCVYECMQYAQTPTRCRPITNRTPITNLQHLNVLKVTDTIKSATR